MSFSNTDGAEKSANFTPSFQPSLLPPNGPVPLINVIDDKYEFLSIESTGLQAQVTKSCLGLSGATLQMTFPLHLREASQQTNERKYNVKKQFCTTSSFPKRQLSCICCKNDYGENLKAVYFHSFFFLRQWRNHARMHLRSEPTFDHGDTRAHQDCSKRAQAHDLSETMHRFSIQYWDRAVAPANTAWVNEVRRVVKAWVVQVYTNIRQAGPSGAK